MNPMSPFRRTQAARHPARLAIALCTVLLGAAPAWAAPPAPSPAAVQVEHIAALIKAANYPQAASVAQDKAAHPDAVARYALQISDANADRRGETLHVAEHLIGQYGKDKLDIEIVAFGPGIKLLMANDNPLAPLIEKLSAQGVRFSACGNAVAHTTVMLGYAPKLVPAARIVRVHDLSVAGYFVDKP
jgi:intracellular sulfur oxidation DsrE/DsrF family protein